MKNLITIIFAIISLTINGQTFNYLSNLKIESKQDSEEFIREAQKAASYILSIPVKTETKNRQQISAFLFKWNSFQLPNGFQINEEISEMIRINQDFLSVFQSCITLEISKIESIKIEFKQIEIECNQEVIKYCETFQLENSNLKNQLDKLKKKYDTKKNKEITAPNVTDKNGLKQGIWREEFSNEQFDFGITNYIDNVLEGEFTAYLSDNTVYMKGSFNNGKMNGYHYTYYKTGELKVRKEYVDGKETGTRITYYENGDVYEKVDYLNDKLHGNYYQYNSDGALKYNAKYANGEKIEK